MRRGASLPARSREGSGSWWPSTTPLRSMLPPPGGEPPSARDAGGVEAVSRFLRALDDRHEVDVAAAGGEAAEREGSRRVDPDQCPTEDRGDLLRYRVDVALYVPRGTSQVAVRAHARGADASS